MVNPAGISKLNVNPCSLTGELAVLFLQADGTVCDCSLPQEQLYGYCRRDLMRQHVSKLFPQLTDIDLISQRGVNPRLCFLCHCGHVFRSNGAEGETHLSRLNVIQLNLGNDASLVRLIVHAAEKA